LDYKEKIGLRFKKIRESLGMSQNEFSEILSMSHQTTSGKIESGKSSPTIPVLEAASKLSGLSIDYIITGKDYTSIGMATNQSFVGMGDIADTPLAKSMFQTLHQISKKVGTIADGVQRFDRIGNELDNLKALQGTASALSTNPEVRCVLNDIRNCCSPGSEGLS